MRRLSPILGRILQRQGAIVACLLGSACGDTPRDVPTHLVVISIDTLRTDAVLGDSPRRAATPGLDEFAAGARTFTNCWSPVPLTLPAHAALLTGRLPAELELHDNTPFPLRGDVPTLATWLGERGFATAGVVGGQPLARGSGIERGFERFDDPPRGTTGSTHFGERDARAVTDAALAAWLQPVGGRRRFLFVHYYDPHQPYAPPRDCLPSAAGAAPSDEARYRGEVTYVDRELGRLLAALRVGGERCLVVITADHGESLGDLGERTHGFQLLPSTLSIPLFIGEIEGTATRPPAALAAVASTRLASLVDLAPTVLPLLGIAPPADLAGIALQTDDAPHPARFVESLAAALQFGCAQQYGVRAEGALLVRGGNDAPTTLEGADWRATGHQDERLLLDPGRAPPSAEELAAWRDAFAAAFARRLPAATDAALPRDLAAIGYLPAPADRERHALLPPDVNAAGRSALARRGAIDALLEAVARLEAGETVSAIATFDQLLAADAELHTARFFRARARLDLEERDPNRRGLAARLAANDLRTLLDALPDYPGAALLHCKALGMAGDFDAAFDALDSAAASARQRGTRTCADVLWLRGGLLLDRERAGRKNARYDPEAGFQCLLEAFELAPERSDRRQRLERDLNLLQRAPDAPAWIAPAIARLKRR